MLSTLFLPLPEELALLGAGYWAHAGSIPLWGAFLAAWSGIIVGDTATFLIGRLLLPRLLRSRLGRRVVSPAMLRWAEQLVQRHGFRAILLGRFLIALRGPVYLAIGASRYPPLKFMLINCGVGVVEVGLVVYAGYLFGHSHAVAHQMRIVDLIIALLLAVLLVVPVLVKRRLERQNARGY